MKSKFNMKAVFVLTLIFQVIIINAQSVSFTYDDAGNRLTRALTITKINEKIAHDVSDTTNSNNLDAASQSSTISVNNEPVINIYPNPTYGVFSVEVITGNINPLINICLFTSNGSQIYTIKNASSINTLDISDRESGTYILTVNVGAKKDSWKIIKK